MRQIDCPDGKAISGFEVYEPQTEEVGFEQQRGRNKNFVATTAFCPQCSKLYEWDNRFGEPKVKWSLNRADYCFDLVYERDEDGTRYVKCNSCGFDLREEPTGMQAMKSSSPKEKRKIDFHQEWLRSVEVNGNHFVMEIEEFKRMAVIGYKSKLTMNPCAKVGSNNYYIPWDDYVEHYESLTVQGKSVIGLARKYWKSL
tara:strand:+ start:2122 stop:2718 length:597 start_codon:yes stop_codon:yes gene_type:complete